MAKAVQCPTCGMVMSKGENFYFCSQCLTRLTISMVESPRTYTVYARMQRPDDDPGGHA